MQKMDTSKEGHQIKLSMKISYFVEFLICHGDSKRPITLHFNKRLSASLTSAALSYLLP